MPTKPLKFCALTLKCCGMLMALFSTAIGLAIISFWLLLPYVADFKQPIEQQLNQLIQHKVSIGKVRGGWHGFRPYLGLENVSILDENKDEVLFHWQEVDVEVDLIASLLQGQFMHGEISLMGVMLQVQRTKAGAFSLVLPEALKNTQKTPSKDGRESWLARIGQQSLRLREGVLKVNDDASGEQYIFENIELFMEYDGVSLQLGGELALPKTLGRRLLVSGRIQGMNSTDLSDINALSGHFYIKAEEVNGRAWASLIPTVSKFLPTGSFSTESWLTLQQGRVQQVHGHVAGHGMAAQENKPIGQRHQAYRVSSNMHWLRNAQGWDLNLKALSVDDGLYVWPSTEAKVIYRHSDELSRLSIGSRFFRLQDGVNLLASIEGLPFVQELEASGLRGDLTSLYFSVEKDTVTHKKDSVGDGSAKNNEAKWLYEAHADFEGLGIEGIDINQFNGKEGFNKVGSNQSMIGFNNLSGHLEVTQGGGTLRLKSQKASLSYSALWSKPLPVERLNGQWQWQQNPQHWRMAGQNIELVMPGFNTKGMFRLTQETNAAEKTSPYLHLAWRVEKADLAQISHYFPKKIMQATFSRWLEQTLQAGKVQAGKVLFRGQLADYPFKQSQGHFEALFDIEQGISAYAPGWPAMRGLNGTLKIDNNRLEVAMKGRVFDSKLNTVNVVMNDMLSKSPRVTLNIASKGPAKDVLAHLTTTPLVESLGKNLQTMQIAQGTMDLNFNLDLPINNKHSASNKILPLTLSGRAKFIDSRLSLSTKSEPLIIDALNGTLRFTEKTLSAKKMVADIMGMPATINVETRPFIAKGSDAISESDVLAQEILVTSSGEFSPLDAERLLQLPVSKWLTGQSAWRSVFKMVTGENPQASVSIASDFLGMQSTLPAPLNKDSTQRRTLHMTLPLTSNKYDEEAKEPPALPWLIEYGAKERGDILSGRMLLAAPKADLPIKRAAFYLGDPTILPALPSADSIIIKGRTPFFSWSQWSEFFTEFSESAESEGRSGVYQEFDLDVKVGRVEMFQRQFLQVAAHANKQPQQWSVTLDAPAIKGLVSIPADIDSPIALDLTYWHWHEKQALENSEGKEEAAITPNDMPSLTLKANDFSFNGMHFGRINLIAKKQENRIVFEHLASDTAKTSITATGEWRLNAQTGQQTTVMDFKVHTQRINHTLSEWKYAQSIKGGRGDAQAHFEWLGAPHDFSLGNLNGDISVYLKDGRLLDVEPGAGRVFGLLSLQSLTKRLALDFSDIFRKGFSFKKIKGQFYVHEGQAFTDDFHMEGPAARVDVDGRVGLLAQDYDQVITVIPQVSSSLPLASALVGGPAVGAAVFIIQKILEPQIDKIVKIKYAVTGSWDNPKVEKVLKAVE